MYQIIFDNETINFKQNTRTSTFISNKKVKLNGCKEGEEYKISGIRSQALLKLLSNLNAGIGSKFEMISRDPLIIKINGFELELIESWKELFEDDLLLSPVLNNEITGCS
mgnify:CR=1 FL=1